ncbi:hypothetical protein [Streptomyces sp. NPDC048269]|uniref:hypothetical protein n=1 Tax=Streptomyces sp. NPDC048269 TaxID=3155753 RepID=UPI0034416A66
MSQSTTPAPYERGSDHPAHAFVRDHHGSTADWGPDTYDLYLDFLSTPTIEREGQ